MNVPAVVVKDREGVGSVLQIIIYFLAFVMIIYTLYKLFGVFKGIGSEIEKKLNEAKNTLNYSDLPNKAKNTAKDVETIAKGVLAGKTNTPEYNEAMSDLHYGGAEWEPGSAPPVNMKNPVLKRYGSQVKPGESKTFHGGYYTETDVNNMVKDPWGGYASKEDALAHKYGFNSYANFNAWLEGVKSALKAEGKDPNAMSLDQIVKYGRELEKKKREWEKQHPEAKPKIDVQPTVPAYLKKYEASDDFYKKLNKWVGESEKTTIIGGSPASRGLIPGDGGYIDVRTHKPLPMPVPIRRKGLFVR